MWEFLIFDVQFLAWYDSTVLTQDRASQTRNWIVTSKKVDKPHFNLSWNFDKSGQSPGEDDNNVRSYEHGMNHRARIKNVEGEPNTMLCRLLKTIRLTQIRDVHFKQQRTSATFLKLSRGSIFHLQLCSQVLTWTLKALKKGYPPS